MANQEIIQTPYNGAVGWDFQETGNSATYPATKSRNFSLQVKGVVAAASSWDVILEGSLNGGDFTTLLSHVTTDGDGSILWTQSVVPVVFVRLRIAGLTLGAASKLRVHWVGVG